ncbi:DUF3179 domain-containing protein [Halocatena marina]|uniref:DUF3179 domain-containing protein n=1 Tax=Halocatena marina TaxID=2934937 RepID=A0ABD5YQT9_9EURY|nr:DUF3179 domain-containing protein [Halocatena marina]
MQVIEGFDTEFIPSIAEPAFERTYFGEHADDLLVIDAKSGARAYPERILNIHHMVNDIISRTPVLVSYCPLCGSAVAYDRRIDGQTLTFEFGGKIVENNLVMRDQETGSEWKRSSGECIRGELAGTNLELHPARMTTWEAFHAAHPSGVVLQRPNTEPTLFQQFAGTTTGLLEHPAGREVMDAAFSLIRAANLARNPETGTETVNIRPFLRLLQGMVELRSWISEENETGIGYKSDAMAVFQREDTFGYLALHGGPRDWEKRGPSDISSKTNVLGATVEDEAVGFARPRIETADGIVMTRFGGTDIVVFATDEELNAFENPGFEFKPTNDPALFEADDAQWNGATGESDDGRTLSRVSTSWTYAYAWQTDHGATSFYPTES